MHNYTEQVVNDCFSNDGKYTDWEHNNGAKIAPTHYVSLCSGMVYLYNAFRALVSERSSP